MRNISKVAVIQGLFAGLMLSACGDMDQDSNLSGSSKKYQLWCLANLNYPNQFGGYNSRTVRAQGTKVYKMDKLKMVDLKKEADEYKAVLTSLQQACNGLYSIMNVSGCSNIRWDKPEVLTADTKTAGQTVFVPFQYTGRFNNVDQTYKGEYFCQMREVATTP